MRAMLLAGESSRAMLASARSLVFVTKNVEFATFTQSLRPMITTVLLTTESALNIK